MMKQVARIKLNEEGTEAAAVTVIGMKNSAMAPRRVNFHATRPFLYVISEQSTGAIFFIGQFMGD
jgi:serpin B